MIYLRLSGGFGNQLFQFLVGYQMSLSHNCKLVVNTSALKNYESKRNLELYNLLDVPTDILFDRSQRFLNNSRFAKLSNLNCSLVSTVNDRNIDRYTNFNFIKGRNVFLDGYFFEKLTQFQFDFACDNIFPLIWPEKIHNLSDRIAVHIRGGDFLNFEQYHICDESYYLDNINRILSMYGDKKIYVVSDDIEYSRKLLTRFKHSVDFISSDMMSDFDFISSSRFIIGSNSTFCFWSALVSGLKSDENKRIILPGEWRRGIQRKIRIKSELI